MEKIILKNIKPADHWTEIGKMHTNHTLRRTSIRYIPHLNKFARELTVHSQAPSVSIRFTPWRTEFRVQRAYETGKDLNGVNIIYVELTKYFDSLEVSGHARARFLPNYISLE